MEKHYLRRAQGAGRGVEWFLSLEEGNIPTGGEEEWGQKEQKYGQAHHQAKNPSKPSIEGLSRDKSTICQTVWWQLPSYPDVQMIITFPHLTRWIQMFHCIFFPSSLKHGGSKTGVPSVKMSSIFK